MDKSIQSSAFSFTVLEFFRLSLEATGQKRQGRIEATGLIKSETVLMLVALRGALRVQYLLMGHVQL